MKDCDKTLVCVYYNIVASTTGIKAIKFVSMLHDRFTFDNSVRCFFLPEYDDNKAEFSTRIEVLNPKYIDKDEYENILNRLNKYLDNK